MGGRRQIENKEVYGIIQKLSMDMTENIERNLNTELKRKGARNDLPREFVDSQVMAGNVPTSLRQWVAASQMHWCTCSVPCVWRSTCNHKPNHDQSTHSVQMARRRASGGMTVAAMAAPMVACMGEVGSTRENMVEVDRPTVLRHNSREWLGRYGERTGANTLMPSG